MTVATAIGPGIYPALPFDQYLAIPACSNTALGWLDESPADCKHNRDKGTGETKAMKFGTAAHTAVLEPERFVREYVIEPDPSQWGKTRGTKGYKEAIARLEIEGLTALTPDEHARVLSLSTRMRGHAVIGPALRKATGTEVTLVWEQDGYPCKARCDWIAPGFLADLKNTREFGGFDPWVFTKYRIYRQAAWYLRGAKALDIDARQFFLAVASSVGALKVMGGFVKDDWIRAGDAEVDRLFADWRACTDADEWPGDVDDLQMFGGTQARMDELFPEEAA